MPKRLSKITAGDVAVITGQTRRTVLRHAREGRLSFGKYTADKSLLARYIAARLLEKR